MRVLLILNTGQLARSLKRYYAFLYDYNSNHILIENYIDSLPNDFYECNIYVIDIYGSGDNSQCALGLQLGKLLDNKQKSIIYFYTQNGLKNPDDAGNILTNCFYLPKQIEHFLSAVKYLPKHAKSAGELLELFQSSSITSGHH